MQTPELFKDLKVIELAGVLAGPSAGYFFAELGAKVIKVENPSTGGDVTRTWKLKSEDPKKDTSSYFWSVNAGKEFLMLDLRQHQQREQLYSLVKDADVVISNYKAGDDKKLGVDYDSLSAIKQDIIYAGINGFGQNSDRAAYDLILQAESGFMSMNGEPGAQPLKMPVALIDVVAGHQLKEAILIALIRKLKEGKGSHISVSLFDSAIASLVNQGTNWLIGKQLPRASGSLHPNIAPYGEIFETKDQQKITFAIGSNKQFKQLCEIIRNPAMARDGAYANNHQRVSNRLQLYSVLYNHVKLFSFKELFELCLKHQVPLGKIRNLKEVFELPEARQMIRNSSYKGEQFETVTGIAFNFLK